MTISDIYEKYELMPMLRMHQLRVAATAAIISEGFGKGVDKESIVTACLLHDMGNIIKSDIKFFAKNIDDRKLLYWERVKSDFIEKYGNDEKTATLQIAEEIGINEKVYKLISSFGFSKAKQIYESNDYEIKINLYSDMRASPHGVTSLAHRLDDLKYRYVEVQKRFDGDGHDYLASFIFKIEQQIFENTKLTPGEITEEKVRPIIKDFNKLEIKTGEL